MNFFEYQNEAMRTAIPWDSSNEMMCNLAMGLAGETGEVVDYLKKVVFHKHDLDKGKIEKELGDLLWYIAVLASKLNIRLDDVAFYNVEKLKKRYPCGYTHEDSKNRR
jgi:NTP pyrophosphatase (non-canonical NTP hydrolase)